MPHVVDETLSDLYPDILVMADDLGGGDRAFYAYRRPIDAAGPTADEEAAVGRGLLLGILRYAPNGPRDDAFWVGDDGEYYTNPREWLAFLSDQEFPHAG